MMTNTAEHCRLLAAKARVKALVVPAESDTYLAIAREYEAIAAVMEANEGGTAADTGAKRHPGGRD